jgi:two-component system, LuxR family, response regulator FixJ
MNPRTLYIVDDNADFLDSTRFWLASDDLDVRTWGDPVQAIEAIVQRDRSEAACLMLDIRMPVMSGLEVHDVLIERDADLPVIYMSGHADVPLAVRAMQKGAVTLLEKPFDEAMVAEALEQAFAGCVRRKAGTAPLQPAVAGGEPEDAAGPDEVPPDGRAGSLDGALSEARSRFAARRSKLSPRERQVIDFVIQGVYNKNIADRIGLSIKTVELYRARGMAKMQARSVAELTRMMITAQAG